jgi:MFS family permease
MCAAQNPAMMIVGRLFAGFASGINLSIIPVYISEISVPATRGIMVGIQGMSIALGYCLANWVGYACTFASGNAQWRIPLGVQCVGTLLIGIAPVFIPYTPRWR